MTFGQAATAAADGSLVPALGGLGALVLLFLGVLKFMGESNTRVDTISGGQITALRDDRDRAWNEVRAAREEAAIWQRTAHDREQEASALRLERERLRWELALARGMGSSGGATPS